MKVQVDGSWLEIGEQESAAALAKQLYLTDEALALRLNEKIVDLHHPLQEGDSLQFLFFSDPQGKEVFWHTSAHLLAQAILRLWPDAQPTIGPPIEGGFYYDFANLTLSEEDFAKIEKEVQKIIKENLSMERIQFKNREEALAQFNSNRYKAELIEGFEESPITAYRQGEFVDLCRGPHLDRIDKIKAFKILKTSGAYWKGDPLREVLTRVYGISYPNRQLLKQYLTFLEEVKKRDHKILGTKLNLFSFQEEAPGMPFIHPKGMIIWNHLIDFIRAQFDKSGYLEIKTPMLMSQFLWERSGHWSHYQEQMYSFSIEERHFSIKPMNCPGAILYYKSQAHSYRQLPFRVAEIGHVHRQEASGALSGLFRVRGFHQDDAHIFLRPSDIKSEILGILKLLEELYHTFGLSYHLELSTRPHKSLGEQETWNHATNSLKEALKEWGEPFQLNEGDGAFYGPKIDTHVRDALGRSWQCGTIQLDMTLPEKFQLEYKDQDGQLKCPILLHRALLGSIERFLAILIEHFGGKFPMWISPIAIRILPIARSHEEYAFQIKKKLEKMRLPCEIDLSEESINKKIRNAQLLQVNYILIIGDREVENKNISIRTRENKIFSDLDLSIFLSNLQTEIETKAQQSIYTETTF